MRLLLLLLVTSPALADWPILDQGPLSASLGSARFTRSDGWLLDGDASYLKDTWGIRASGSSTGLLENWEQEQTCSDDLPGFTTRLHNHGRVDADWAMEREGFRLELGGAAQGIIGIDQTCTPFAFEESTAQVEGLEFLKDDVVFWRAGGSGGLAVWGDSGLLRMHLSALRQVDFSQHTGVYRAAIRDEDGERTLDDDIDFSQDILQSWSISGRVVGKWRLLDGNLILRTQSSAERFSHSQQSISWSRQLQESIADGSDVEESLELRQVETVDWWITEQTELTIGQARFGGFGLRVWQALDWSTDLPDGPDLAFGLGLRYGDDG